MPQASPALLSPPFQPLRWEEQTSSAGRRLQLSGDLTVHTLHAARRLLEPRTFSAPLLIDLEHISQIDSSGAAFLISLWRLGHDRGLEVRLDNVPGPVHDFLELFHLGPSPTPPASPPGLLEGLGSWAFEAADAALELLVLAADTTLGALSALLRPRRLRWAALLEQSIYMGSQALGVVGLITFLVGLTLAFQSAHQLQRFGAAIYVAALTAISTVREMGPLITAILVAGRSGSAITSEVATMKVNEEVDALHVMGIPFVDFVAVPKLLALLTMLPLLTLMADLLSILGGLCVGIFYLELTVGPYMNETLESLDLWDVSSGLIKSLVFAWGIALIGLYQGLKVTGGAQEVGRATTASVVSAIFFIIIADSLFSILFYVIL